MSTSKIPQRTYLNLPAPQHMPKTISEKFASSRPSSNWFAMKIKKNFVVTTKDGVPQKRCKLDPSDASPPAPNLTASKLPLNYPTTAHEATSNPDALNEESISYFRTMIDGKATLTPAQRLPGKYLALDCEMVGVGPEGVESSLARVSLVNFYGYTILDVFVRQKERVTDYRTRWSGVRERDLFSKKAMSFEEVQKVVNELLQDRVLVGHAVHNDLKALLLAHPRPMTRDTQYYAHKSGLSSQRPALRNLVRQYLGITIQDGEHSSVTDARATMALYRLYKKEWEKSNTSAHLHLHLSKRQALESSSAGKRKHVDDEDEDHESKMETRDFFGKGVVSTDTDKAVPKFASKPSSSIKSRLAATTFPGGGRKGVSSKLSTITSRTSKGPTTTNSVSEKTTQWWKELPKKEQVAKT